MNVKRKRHGEFARRHQFHRSATFMDLLHGDVEAGEARLACLYEYARESPLVWRAAKLRDRRNQIRLGPDRRARAAGYAYEATRLRPAGPLAEVLLRFLGCKSFPAKDWNELSTRDRTALAIGEPRIGSPLRTTDVWTLQALGVFEAFKKRAHEADPRPVDVLPGAKGSPYRAVEPVLRLGEASPIYRVLFDIDFSQSKKQLWQAFNAWLDLVENQKRFKEHRTVKYDSGTYLNKLKTLAAWRLYREFGNRWEVANEFADEHRKRVTDSFYFSMETGEERKRYTVGQPRPFYAAKGKAANTMPLFSEAADGSKVKGEAWKYLAVLMPDEFAESDISAFGEIDELGR